jgi:DNA-binding PadR family transcriptional regulator
MEHVVLGLLMIQSLTLYDLYRAFTQGISMFYSASYGSLQVAVRNLLKKGLVVYEEKVDKGRNKKVYSITDQGRSAFYAWMLSEIQPNKLEVIALSRVYFLGLLPSLEQRRQVVLEILKGIDLAQRQLGEVSSEYSRLEVPDLYKEILKYQLATLDYGVQAHVFARGWFQALLQELGETSSTVKLASFGS